jgi:hypothetical protein
LTDGYFTEQFRETENDRGQARYRYRRGGTRPPRWIAAREPGS